LRSEGITYSSLLALAVRGARLDILILLFLLCLWLLRWLIQGSGAEDTATLHNASTQGADTAASSGLILTELGGITDGLGKEVVETALAVDVLARGDKLRAVERLVADATFLKGSVLVREEGTCTHHVLILD
jgi:hypothetical protein